MGDNVITAIILAGGQGSRMDGQDKGLAILQGKPLYQHVIDHIKSQVATIMISANRNIETYKLSSYAVFVDDLPGYLGPLSGIYSGLLHSQTEWNLIVSCDTPFLPDDLVSRFKQSIADSITSAAYAFDGERHHPTILLIHKSTIPKLKQYLEHDGRKLMLFLQQIKAIAVDFSDKKACFMNMNTPEDLEYWN